MSIFAVVCVVLACSFVDAQVAYSIGVPDTPPPEVLPNGYLADTPDVAAAKASHLYEVSKATYAAAKAAYDAYYSNANDENSNDEKTIDEADPIPVPAATSYVPVQQDEVTVLPNGYIADTPEVAAAKDAHSYEVSRANYLSAKALYDAYYSASAAPTTYTQTAYNDAPLAVSYIPAEVKVLPNGYIADTPEVAAAKAEHSYEVSKAEYLAAKAAYDAYYGGAAYSTPLAYSINADAPVSYSYRAPIGYSLVPYPISYYRAYSPPAEITVLPDGHIADTPEVAQAKTLHYAAKAKAEAEAAIATPI